jgi:hypothetical protein
MSVTARIVGEDLDGFIRAVKNTRNYFTHHDPAGEAKATTEPRDPYRLTVQLRAILRAHSCSNLALSASTSRSSSIVLDASKEWVAGKPRARSVQARMSPEIPVRRLPAMYARAVDDAQARLRELRSEEWGHFGLAAVAIGLAVAASEASPALAVPLFLGGLALGAFGLRAFWHRWDLLERLAGERDAHVIPDVLAYASREAKLERRHALAAVIRSRLTEPEPGCETRLIGVMVELGALASELDDGALALDPACAVACTRLLSDTAESPLLNPALPAEDLRSRVHQIRSGFRPVGVGPATPLR